VSAPATVTALAALGAGLAAVTSFDGDAFQLELATVDHRHLSDVNLRATQQRRQH
jgi:hypothetical protein